MLRCLLPSLVIALATAVASAQPQPLGEATSLEVNRSGIGHLLVVPYFNTQAGNATLVNLYNTSDTGKAVLLRYRSAGNGDELFSLQVFLRAHDAWAAGLATNLSGLPAFEVPDKSCTLPAVINGESFRTGRLDPALTTAARAEQAREGYIEIITLGDIVVGTPLDQTVSSTGASRCAMAVLGALTRFDAQLAPPTTGLFANWILLNVPQTTTWSGEALAFEARRDGLPSTGNNVYFPPTSAALSAQDVTDYSADPLFNFANGGPIVAPVSRDLPDLSTPYTATVPTAQEQATELSFEIAAQVSAIEYLTDTRISALTDWIVSMPTLRYHAAVDYRRTELVSNWSTFGDEEAIYLRHVYVGAARKQPCQFAIQAALLAGYDREGLSTTDHVVPGPTVELCGAVAVLTTSGGADAPSWSAVRASATRTALLQPDFGTDGYARFAGAALQGSLGLPAEIRHFWRAVNPVVAPGFVGTYGMTGAGRTLVPGRLP